MSETEMRCYKCGQSAEDQMLTKIRGKVICIDCRPMAETILDEALEGWLNEPW